ncbi:cytochrome b5-like [Euwallacea fornicatus]|uniref:cytochrome b5-like n=1 Tax=Euwallacea fornicatus TaxID=995702 RepID=UPI00338E6A09
MAKVIRNIFMNSSSSSSSVATSQPAVQSAKRVIDLQEVSWHDTIRDCWIVVYDRVYDITGFLEEHPGGDEILMEYAGRDASIAFRDTGHSGQAVRLLEKYFIGELPVKERIFRISGGLTFSDMPI